MSGGAGGLATPEAALVGSRQPAPRRRDAQAARDRADVDPRGPGDGSATARNTGTGRPTAGKSRKGGDDRMSLIVLIVLILVLVAALPTWPYSSGWGYYPSGGAGLVLLVLVILLLTGRL